MSIIKFENGQSVRFDGTPTPQDIEEVEKQLKIKKPKAQVEQKEPGFFGRIGGIIGERAEKLGEISDVSDEQTLAESAFQTTGQATGALGEVAFETAKTGISGTLKGLDKVRRFFTPKFLEDLQDDLNEKTKKAITETNIFQESKKSVGEIFEAGFNTFEDFEKEHPRAGRNIRAALNIAEVLPATKGAEVGAKVTKELAGEVVETGAELAGKAGRALKESAEEGLEAQQKKFIRELVTPEKTKKVGEAQVKRTKVEGPLKTKVVEPDARQLEIEKAVSEVPGVGKEKLIQENFNLIDEANTKIAKQLEADIKAENFEILKSDTLAKLDEAKKALSESPTIVGDAEKTAERLLVKARSLVEEASETGEGILKARKDYDNWVKTQKPKLFSAESENALSIANREIRNALTDILDEKAISTKVKDSLKRQSSLFRALETLTPKAFKESATAGGRTFQKISKLLGTKNKTVQALTALGLIGGATLSPSLAVAGGVGLGTFKGIQALTSPRVKKLLGEALEQIEKIGKSSAEIEETKGLIKDLLK